MGHHQLVRFLAFVFLGFVSFTSASYSIDDRDPRIQYFGPHWGQHDDPTAYMGTTTDNACVTADGCYFTVSFNGSGISLTRFIITTIPIPLQATVTVDSIPKPDISIPDGSPAATVYDLQSLTYGAHVMRVDLVSYSDGVQSHFRLDQAIINDTTPLPATTTPYTSATTSAPTSAASTSHSSTAIPATAQSVKKKTPIAAIVGGAVGGVVVLVVLVSLLLFSNSKRRNRAKPLVEIDRMDTEELTPTPFIVSTPFAAANTPHDQPPVAPSNFHPPFMMEFHADPLTTGPPEATITATSPSIESQYPASPIHSPFGTTYPAYLSPPPSTMMHTETVSTGHTDTDMMSIQGSTVPSIATSEPLMPRFGMLDQDDVKVMAQLMRQGISVPDALRILEAKQNLEETDGSVGVRRAESSVASTSAAATSVGGVDVKGESAGVPEPSGDHGEPSGAPPAYAP